MFKIWEVAPDLESQKFLSLKEKIVLNQEDSQSS
jgi:hypothetical protein